MAGSTKASNFDINIGDIVVDLNNKVDKSDLREAQCVIETYVNGTSWYRVWSDGWCEQGGSFTSSTGVNQVLRLLKPYNSTQYWVYISSGDVTDATPIVADAKVKDKESFYYVHGYAGTTYADVIYWKASGYIEV